MYKYFWLLTNHNNTRTEDYEDCDVHHLLKIDLLHIEIIDEVLFTCKEVFEGGNLIYIYICICLCKVLL